MKTIIAIDPSLSATGLAVWRAGQPLYLGTVHTQSWEDVNGWTMPNRLDRIVRAVTGFISPGETIATIEGQIKPSNEAMRGTSTLDVAQLRGALTLDLYREQVPINIVHPSTLKAYVKPGRCNKADMLREARTVLGAKNVVDNDNEADAFWLLAMTLHRYGYPVCRRTPRRKTFVEKVDWWHFNMEADR